MLFLLLSFFAIVFAILVFIVRARGNSLMFISAILVSVILLGGMGTFVWINYRAGIRHLVHLITQPKDLYEPIVVDAFPFWELGFSKSYSLVPKYMDIYEIGLLATDENLSSKEKFTGKVKVEFLCKDKIISEHEITAIHGGVYAGKDMTRYKKVSLMSFEMPVQGKYKKDISVRMTVLKSDQNLKKYGDSLQMYIAVSSSP